MEHCNICIHHTDDERMKVTHACPVCLAAKNAALKAKLEAFTKEVLSVGTVFPDDTSEKPSVIYGHPDTKQWVKIFLLAKAELKTTRKPEVSESTWVIEYEHAGKCWRTAVEHYTAAEAKRMFEQDNPHVTVRECYPKK